MVVGTLQVSHGCKPTATRRPLPSTMAPAARRQPLGMHTVKDALTSQVRTGSDMLSDGCTDDLVLHAPAHQMWGSASRTARVAVVTNVAADVRPTSGTR